MKKLRMVVTSVIVLSIIGSAFAFKAKIGVFCILTSLDPGDDCTAVIFNRKRVAGNPTVKYAPLWDGSEESCTAANNDLCTTFTRLETND